MSILYKTGRGGPVLSGVDSGLGTLRAELASGPREVSCWQIAMRSFPPKLWSPGNPGGIGKSGTADERAWRAVPDMWTRLTPNMWPVGSKALIQTYISNLMAKINAALYNNTGLPKMDAVKAGDVNGIPVYVDIPTSGLSPAVVESLRSAAGQGIRTLDSRIQEISGGRLPTDQRQLANRAITAVANSTADLLGTIAQGGFTNADLARDILQGLSGSMLAVAPSIPFGIGYAIAGVLQIAAWAAGAWDKGVEAAEMIGYSYHWSESQQKQVLRYRVMIQTCAGPETLAGIDSMSIGDVRSWLRKTGYGLDHGPNWNQRVERAIANASALAVSLGDPLLDARMIREIGNYLKYIGASEEEVTKIDHWLWDARRMERIDKARRTGEVDYKAGSYGSIHNIGLFPNYWRDWAYDGQMTPERFTRADLASVRDMVRGQIVPGLKNRFFSKPASMSLEQALGPELMARRQQMYATAQQKAVTEASTASSTLGTLATVGIPLAGLGALLYFLSGRRSK